MQKNEARANEQRRAASFLVLHSICSERFLLASAGDATRIRRRFGLRGTKFANVMQFVS